MAQHIPNTNIPDGNLCTRTQVMKILSTANKGICSMYVNGKHRFCGRVRNEDSVLHQFQFMFLFSWSWRQGRPNSTDSSRKIDGNCLMLIKCMSNITRIPFYIQTRAERIEAFYQHQFWFTQFDGSELKCIFNVNSILIYVTA